jgi:hypothetical protein
MRVSYSGTPGVFNIGSLKMNLDDRVREIELEMAQHDAQCEERWKTTFNRLMDIETSIKRMENRIVVGAGSVIVFLAGVIVSLL